MKKIVVLGLCLVLLLGAVQVMAAGLAGKNEISAAAAWVRASNDDGPESISATLVGAAYGRYITENFEIKLDVIYADSEGMSAWVIGPAAIWNFTPKVPSSVVPYIGVGALWANIDADGTDSSFNLEYMAGVKLFIGGTYDCADKNVFVEYRHSDIEMFGGGADVDMVWTGISTIF